MASDYVIDADIVVGFRGEHAIKVVLTPEAADRLMAVCVITMALDLDLETRKALDELFDGLRGQYEQLPDSALPEGATS